VHDYQLQIRPASRVHGALAVPGDKSISHRYAMFSLMARGVTTITHLAPGADVAATVACLRALGTTIEAMGPQAIRVHGRAPEGFRPATAPHHGVNSRTQMRH